MPKQPSEYRQLQKRAKELQISSYGVKAPKLKRLIAEAEKALKEPKGVVGFGIIQPPKEPNSEPLVPSDPNKIKVGDVVQCVQSGEKFKVEKIEGDNVLRKVNQTERGYKVHALNRLRKLGN